MNKQILIAGFGGQGILFSGKFLAYEGLLDGKNVTWLPSYGPEMRGGTANCSIIISDTQIGSPIVDKPDALIAMNAPSYDKYINEVKPGGQVFVDSSLIDKKCDRDDIEVYYIPATKIASDEALKGLANMIMIGLFVKKSGIMTIDKVETTMAKLISGKKANMLESNMKAVKIGYDYVG